MSIDRRIRVHTLFCQNSYGSSNQGDFGICSTNIYRLVLKQILCSTFKFIFVFVAIFLFGTALYALCSPQIIWELALRIRKSPNNWTLRKGGGSTVTPPRHAMHNPISFDKSWDVPILRVELFSSLPSLPAPSAGLAIVQ